MAQQAQFKFSQKSLTLLVASIVLGIPILWYIFAGISVRNEEASLRAQFTAVQSANRVDYDAMWKIVKESFGVAEQERSTFTKAYSTILQAPDSSGKAPLPGMLLAMGVNPPKVDSSLYGRVQTQIEAERTQFANVQIQLLDIKREHDRLRTTFPGSMFVGSAIPLEAKLVTSARTDSAFTAGRDDETLVTK